LKSRPYQVARRCDESAADFGGGNCRLESILSRLLKSFKKSHKYIDDSPYLDLRIGKGLVLKKWGSNSFDEIVGGAHSPVSGKTLPPDMRISIYFEIYLLGFMDLWSKPAEKRTIY